MPSFIREATPENSIPQLDAGVHKQSAGKFKRMRLTKAQTQFMESVFLRDHYPSTEYSLEIARSLQCPLHSIQIWFQNRRAKERRCGDGSIQLIPPRLARQIEQARVKNDAGLPDGGDSQPMSDQESHGSDEALVPAPTAMDDRVTYSPQSNRSFTPPAVPITENAQRSIPFFPTSDAAGPVLSFVPVANAAAPSAAPAVVAMDTGASIVPNAAPEMTWGQKAWDSPAKPVPEPAVRSAPQFSPEDMRAAVAAAFAAGNASAYASALAAAFAAGRDSAASGFAPAPAPAFASAPAPAFAPAAAPAFNPFSPPAQFAMPPSSFGGGMPAMTPAEYAAAYAAIAGQCVYPPPTTSVNKFLGVQYQGPQPQEVPSMDQLAMQQPWMTKGVPQPMPPNATGARAPAAAFSRAAYERSIDPYYGAAATSERDAHLRAARMLESMGRHLAPPAGDTHEADVAPTATAGSPTTSPKTTPKSKRPLLLSPLSPPTVTSSPVERSSRNRDGSSSPSARKAPRSSRSPPAQDRDAAVSDHVYGAGAGAFVDFIMQQQQAA